MSLLQLHFSDALKPELVESSFEHPLLQRRLILVRGKSEGAHSGRQTFQWTPAVKALCFLLIKTRVMSLLATSPTGIILLANGPGEVSALDYAIGRRAEWISAMFGSDSHGNPIAQRVLRRSNPERKRPGPVSISLNQNFLSINRITFYRDGLELTKTDELLLLMRQIANETELDNAAFHSPIYTGDLKDDFLVDLKPHFLHEMRQMLYSTDIFSKRLLREALNEIALNPSLKSVNSQLLDALEETDLRFAGASRLGLNVNHHRMTKLFSSDRLFKFGVTPSQSGTLVLLTYLRDTLKLPIEIDYSFAHTSDLARTIDSNNPTSVPDFCVMTTASFALLRPGLRREYRPIMVMPSATHSVLGPRTDSPQTMLARPSKYFFLSDFPTTPLLWFERLKASGVIPKGNVTSIHAEPDEALAALRTGDPDQRAILWFPYNLIAQRASSMIPLLSSAQRASGIGRVQNILFGKSSLVKSTESASVINVLLRDAWLTLLADQGLSEQLASSLLVEKNYRKAIWRYGGLYQLSNESIH